MNMDLLLLVSGGLVALVAGGWVVMLSPGRLVSSIAGAALATLGLLQFAFARAVYELASSGRTAWFGNALALAVPVSALWLLLSVTLGRGGGARGLGGWRPYLVLQAGASIAASVYAVGRGTESLAASPDRAFHLQGAEGWMLACSLLNMILVAAKFEATYLSFTPRYRDAFRPALLGVLGASGLLGYLIVYTLLTGAVSTEDVSMSAAPAMLLSLLLPLSLIRGRIGEARPVDIRLPVTATNSLLVAFGFVASTSALLWLTRAAGMGLGEGLLVITILGVGSSIAALTISNRLRRRLEQLLDPIWYEPRASRRPAFDRVGVPLEGARSIEELCRLIPQNARTVAEVDPVTLFLEDGSTRSYRPVASTMDPAPTLVILDSEPLAMELRRAHRPIRLVGRADDLEYVSIYVENARQIAACEAVCAVPIQGDAGLLGFMLCGARGGGRQVHGEELVLLNLAARQYAEQIERFLVGEPPAGTDLS